MGQRPQRAHRHRRGRPLNRSRPLRVLISGAGIAGLTLAYWLQRAGHEPTLIEAAPSLPSGGYMIDFGGVGYDVAERMGLLPAIRDAAYDIEEIRYVDRNNRMRARIASDTIRRAMGDRAASVRRGDLASVIFDSLEERVETLFASSILSIDRPGHYYVRVQFISGLQRNFDVVVGADGLHSNVRALMLGQAGVTDRHLGYYVAAFEAAGYRPRDDRIYVSCSAPGRQISRFALRGDRTTFLLVFAAEQMARREPMRAQRKAALEQVFDGFGWEWPQIRPHLRDAVDLYFSRVSQAYPERWFDGRLALVGDAAACVSLVAGEGVGLAMAEAYVLAGELARRPLHPEESFAAYADRLGAFVREKQREARAFASSLAPRTPLGVWARNQALRFMTMPGVSNLLLRSQMRDDFELPEYPELGGATRLVS